MNNIFLNKIYRDKLIVRVKNLFRRVGGHHYRRSYSQCGEDVIARTVFDMLGIPCPSYLDIGAHHPTYLNNTYIFYRAGSRGINVEPDPRLFAKFKNRRAKDLNLNVGVGKEAGVLDLYILSTRTLNTFSLEEAKGYEAHGFKIVDKVSVPVITINELLDAYITKTPDFLSVDVEGLDYSILSTLNFRLYRPALICVETIIFSNTGIGVKRDDIAYLLEKNGYVKFADTYINTLYVDAGRWSDR